MKFYPRANDFFNDVFDNVWHEPFLRNENSVMKTDITEKDGNYLLDMELPGCKKEDIQIALHDGYLNISASRNTSHDEKDDQGNLIRQERFSGSYQRNFYVGENIREEDIKANYENGELKIIVPKDTGKKVEEKKFIPIE